MIKPDRKHARRVAFLRRAGLTRATAIKTAHAEAVAAEWAAMNRTATWRG